MACIEKTTLKNGNTSYKVSIRKKGHELFKTFSKEEDAVLFAEYKEWLIQCIENFETPLPDRITLKDIFEMKIQSVKREDRRTLGDLNNCYIKLSSALKKHLFLCELSYDDWLEACKKIANIHVYKGAKNDFCARLPSIKSLRRYFAVTSSCFSHAISKGINIENHPLKVVQSFINPQFGEKNV